MPLESTLRRELEREIEAEAEAIRRRAEQQGESLMEDAQRRARERKEEAEKNISAEGALHTRRALARAEMEQRNALLRIKRRELDLVFERVADEIAGMRETDPSRYSRLMGNVLENCRRLLPPTSLRVRLGPGLEDLERRLTEEGEMSVELDEGLFGVVVEAGEGRVHCDGTVPRLLERIRREREAELEEILFGGTT